MDELHYRHEMKFVCTENNLYIMEEKVRHICHPDIYAGTRGTYVVRSLYFDTYEDDCLQERLNGEGDGKKYRIRIYDGSAEMINLECKYSSHGMKAKKTCRINERQCEQLIHGAAVGKTEASQEVLRQFLAERSIKLLMPKVIVEYTRSPYVCEMGNVRVTFDRNIRFSTEISRFLEKGIAWRGIMPEGKQLLEVKYDKVLPGAVMDVLAGGQMMNRTSFSKYVLCRMYGMR